MAITLTIGIISVTERRRDFLPKLLDIIEPQIGALPVEILVLSDNRRRTVGEKRNALIELAQGDYIVQVDDDDTVSPDFVASILAACNAGSDCVVYDVWVTVDGEQGKPCHYGLAYEYVNKPEAYYRRPNPRMVIRTELARKVRFKPVNFGEDDEWAERLRPHLGTETRINKVLYYYNYSPHTSQTSPERSPR